MEKDIDEIEMVKIAENFFISLGFEPLSDTFGKDHYLSNLKIAMWFVTHPHGILIQILMICELKCALKGMQKTFL